jgi:hypothetical protein
MSLLIQMDKLEWEIGDLVNKCKSQNEIFRVLQHDKYRLKIMARVATDFPASLRNKNLPFSIHAELYGMSKREKQKYLDKAKTENLTAVELRKIIRKSHCQFPPASKPIHLDKNIKKEFYGEKSRTI